MLLNIYFASFILSMSALTAVIIIDRGIKVGQFLVLLLFGIVPILNLIMAVGLTWAMVPDKFWEMVIFKRK